MCNCRKFKYCKSILRGLVTKGMFVSHTARCDVYLCYIIMYIIASSSTNDVGFIWPT